MQPDRESQASEPKINRILRSRRKSLALVVEHDGTLTVRAPNRLPRHVIEEFVESHQAWILNKQEQARAAFRRRPEEYLEGASFPYLGEWHPLKIVPGQKEALFFDGSFKLAEWSHAKAKQAFETWYRERAREVLSARVKLLAEAHGFQFKTIRITSARARWGACSSKNGLSFSWRLILTPIEVVDYVVIHELVHTLSHNHSKQFWKKLESILPDYREQREWLKKHGPGLMA